MKLRGAVVAGAGVGGAGALRDAREAAHLFAYLVF